MRMFQCHNSLSSVSIIYKQQLNYVYIYTIKEGKKIKASSSNFTQT